MEVPVPIYINNKEEKLGLGQVQRVESSQSQEGEMSIAVHEESVEMDRSEVISSAKKSGFKIDNEVRSYRYAE